MTLNTMLVQMVQLRVFADDNGDDNSGVDIISQLYDEVLELFRMWHVEK